MENCFCGAQFRGAVKYDLRRQLFQHILRMQFSGLDQTRVGQLLSRLISDIAEIGQLMLAIPNLVIVCSITMTGRKLPCRR